MAKKKDLAETPRPIETSKSASSPESVYRALTGLENAAGARVESGETVPAGFVPDWQLQYWLAQGDVTMIETVSEEVPQ